MFAQAFADELLKIKLADLMIGPEGGRVTAGGIFIGGDEKMDYEAAGRQIRALAKKHGSLRKARDAYAKANPERYTTMAFKLENAPEKPGLLKRFFTLGGATRKHRIKTTEFEGRTSKPKIFFAGGPSGGPMQSEFYRDVARGTYDPRYTIKL